MADLKREWNENSQRAYTLNLVIFTAIAWLESSIALMLLNPGWEWKPVLISFGIGAIFAAVCCVTFIMLYRYWQEVSRERAMDYLRASGELPLALLQPDNAKFGALQELLAQAAFGAPGTLKSSLGRLQIKVQMRREVQGSWRIVQYVLAVPMIGVALVMVLMLPGLTGNHTPGLYAAIMPGLFTVMMLVNGINLIGSLALAKGVREAILAGLSQ